MPTPPPPIRVSRYNSKLGLAICERIATTPVSLAKLCREPEMPSVSTLMRWLREHEEFRESYTIAKESQIDLLAEEILDIADDNSHDLTTAENGRTVANTAAVQRSKVRIESRKWLAAKLLPRKYGDKSKSIVAPASSAPPSDDAPPHFVLTEEMRLQLIEHRRQMFEEPAEEGGINDHLVNSEASLSVDAPQTPAR